MSDPEAPTKRSAKARSAVPDAAPAQTAATAAPAGETASATAAAPPKDRQALALQYMPYVRHIAGRIRRKLGGQIEYADLVEYGMIGLLEAADRYDPTLGTTFMTFAYYRIRGAIYDGLRGMGWLSRTQYAKARFEERANAYLGEVAQGAAASEATEASPSAEAQAEMGPLEHAVHDLATAVQGLAAVYITSLDAASGLQLSDTARPLPEEQLGLEQNRALVRTALKKLNAQERQLLQLYYYKDMSLQQVGEKLGLSKSWTSRLHARVVDKLHRMLEDSIEG
jgi:RNA polymerase sigma factor for flagellar operon FliA